METVQRTVTVPARRTFLIAAALAGCVVAAIVIVLWLFDVGPFSPTVSDRVSESLGVPAKCSTLGFAEIAGERTKVYSCATRLNGGDAVLCRAVIDGEVVTVADSEYRGCGP